MANYPKIIPVSPSYLEHLDAILLLHLYGYAIVQILLLQTYLY